MSTVAANLRLGTPSYSLPQKPWLTGLCLAAADGAVVSFAIALGFAVLRIWIHKSMLLADGTIPVASALLGFGLLGLYTVVGLSPAQEFQKILLGSTVGYGVSLIILFARLNSTGAQLVFALTWAFIILTVPVCRDLLRRVCYDKPWWGTPTVIFGSGTSARALFHAVRTQPSLGLKIVAIFDNDYRNWKDFDGHRVHLGTVRSAHTFVEGCGIEHA